MRLAASVMGNAKSQLQCGISVCILQGELSLLGQLCQLGLHLGQLEDSDQRKPAVRESQSGDINDPKSAI